MSVAQQRSRILLDEEYYLTPQPPPSQQQQPPSPPPPPPQQQPSTPSVEEYLRSTEHLFESQAPSPVSEFSIVKTGAGNIYVYTASSGWQKLEYKPETNTYSLTPASLPDITAEAQKLGATGYKLEPTLAEKIAREEPSTLMFYGVEDALRYAKLREMFPELRGKENITEADVWHALRQRLEKYGWKPDTPERWETLENLTRAALQNPDTWKLVESDIQRQMEEARSKQEELATFYAAKALKQWDAERETLLKQQIEQQYKFFESAPTPTLFVSGVGRGFLEGITLGLLPKDWLPKDTGHFYEALYERYRELSLKPLEQSFEKIGLKPLLDATRFMSQLTGSPVSPLLSNPDVWAPVAKEYLKGQERIELEVLQKQLTHEKRAAYGLGYGLGSVLGLGALNVVASKTIEPVAQKALGRLASYSAEHPESTLTKVAEKLRIVERQQLVPKEVESVIVREAEGTGRGLIAKTRVLEWGKAEDILGRRMPESMRLGEREISLLPLEGGAKVPVAKGEFFVVGSEKVTITKEGGLKLVDPFALYVRGTGEESLIAARFTAEKAVVSPRMDVLAVRARVDYAKVLEQVQGGLPRAVLLEEGDLIAGVSRTPKIPVKETFTPGKVPGLPPMVLVPKLPVKEEEREWKGPEIRTPLKIPSIESIRPPDVSIKPFSIPSSSVKPLQALKPETAEMAAPKTGEFSIQLPRVEPKAAETAIPKLGLPEVQLPRLEPRLEPRATPKTEPPQLPKVPPLPVPGGTRDLPIARSLKMFSRKLWEEEWFGDLSLDSGGRTRTSRRGGKRGKRGGRR